MATADLIHRDTGRILETIEERDRAFLQRLIERFRAAIDEDIHYWRIR